MGVFRIVLGAMRGAGTLGVVAIDRMSAEAPRTARAQPPVARAATPQRGSGLEVFYPSQSESAALLDRYLDGTGDTI